METLEKDTVQLTVRLPRDLRQRLKVAQVYDGRSMNSVVVSMIEAWVTKQEKATSGKGGAA